MLFSYEGRAKYIHTHYKRGFLSHDKRYNDMIHAFSSEQLS